MRLIRCETLELVEFYEPPPYAILSHTWEDEEVTYQEMKATTPQIEKKAGYDKIIHAVLIAEDYGFDYIWIDTCCIDKTSSAELSEAINSMYQWYKEAAVCFVALTDISSTRNAILVGSNQYQENRQEHARAIFRECRWITRGWTLQELIAPSKFMFFDSAWECFGSKRDMTEPLSDVTGIDRNVLESGDLSSASVAQKMSWAADRNTSRREDLAYCLMGIFGVNMPLLYGEGRRAFLRLQEEILKRGHVAYRGLLAQHPAEFRLKSRYWGGRYHLAWKGPAPSKVYEDLSTTLTNKGIRFLAPLLPVREVLISLHTSQPFAKLVQILTKTAGLSLDDLRDFQANADDLYVAILNCDKGIGIIMLKLEDQDQYVRVYPQTMLRLTSYEPRLDRIYVRQQVRIPKHHQSNRLSALIVRYHDYVNYTSGNNRKIQATDPDHPSKFSTDGLDNGYQLRVQGKNETRDDQHFTFSIAIGSVYHDVVEVKPELLNQWRNNNDLQQFMYGAEEEVDEDPDLWYNRWRGIVNVSFAFYPSTGVYQVAHHYDPDGKGARPGFLPMLTKQHSNFGGLLTVAKLGRARVEFEISAETKLIGGYADVVLDIRESVVETKSR